MRISALIIILSIVGCREIEEPTSIGFDYFPLALENEWVYKVHSIHFDDFTQQSDTYSYWRKEVIVEIADITSETDRYYADVSFRSDTTDWQYFKTMLMYNNDIRAVRSIDNKPIVHLLFPVKARVFWDGNQLNSASEDRFRYINAHKSRATLADSFSNNVFVQQAFDTTIIDEDIRWELFAEDVGLIEKQTISLEKQQNKRKGYELRWKLNSFTKK